MRRSTSASTAPRPCCAPPGGSPWLSPPPPTWAAPGADRTLSGFLDFGDGLSGSFDVSFELPPFQRLELIGTTAAIVADLAFNPGLAPAAFDVVQLDGSTATSSFGGSSAYLGMVEHVSAVVLDGATPRHGRDETLAVARTIDRARAAAAS